MSVISGNSTFIQKLHAILEDDSNRNLIAWTASGDGFKVVSPTEFSRRVLPQSFKHSNFSSFVRQLNMYGFHKVTEHPFSIPSPATSASSPNSRFSNSDTNDTEAGLCNEDVFDSKYSGPYSREQPWEFRHPYFKRGEFQLMAQIKRKTSKPNVSQTTAFVSPASSPVSCAVDLNYLSYLEHSLLASSQSAASADAAALPSSMYDPVLPLESRLHALECEMRRRLTCLEREAQHQLLARRLAVWIHQFSASLHSHANLPWVSELCGSIDPLLSEVKKFIQAGNRCSAQQPLHPSRTSISSLLGPMMEHEYDGVDASFWKGAELTHCNNREEAHAAPPMHCQKRIRYT